MSDVEHPVLAAHAARDRGDVDSLLALLTGTHVAGRRSAALGLGELGSARAVVPLVRCLQANDELLRNGALKALAKIGDPSAIPAVFEVATSDNSFGVRATAVDTLARLGDRRSVAVLGSMLLEEKGPYSRSFPKWAAKLLVEIDGFEAIPQLEAASRASGPITRFRLRRAMRRLRATEESLPRSR